MKIDAVSEGLDGRDDAGRKRAPGHNLEVSSQCPEGQAAKIPQELTLVLEEDPQRLGYGEDDLAMGHVQKERLPHPRRPGPRALPGGPLPPYSPVLLIHGRVAS